VKRYVVRLSSEEREQLQALIRKGKGPASRLLKARILVIVLATASSRLMLQTSNLAASVLRFLAQPSYDLGGLADVYLAQIVAHR
jgi:hypothetical protein